MSFSYRTLNIFCDYNSLENCFLRNSVLMPFELCAGKADEYAKISRTFPVDSYFDFIRFFNLTNFIFGYRKPLVFSKSKSFFVFSRMFKSKFLYVLLRNIAIFQRSPKGSFLKLVYFDNGMGFVRIREPHVAFSVTSPYFDYHTSKLNLNFSFLYKNNPQFLYKLIWLFGILPNSWLLTNFNKIFFVNEIASIYL